MSLFKKMQSLLSAFSKAQDVPDHESFCHFGQNKTLNFLHTEPDHKGQHIQAIFDVETLAGATVRARLYAAQIAAVLKTYPPTEAAPLRALNKAALHVQAEDSLLQKTRSQTSAQRFHL